MSVIVWTPPDVAAATERFARAVVDADPSAEVPACPQWTVLDLVTHLGNVHVWAAGIVASGDAVAEPDDRPDGDLPRWYAERAAHLVSTLEASDSEAACWNFAGVGEVAGFWVRRQLLETLMHLVDLDQACRRPTELDPTICADGVSETFEVFVPRMHARGHEADLAAPVSFRAVDTGETWTLLPRRGAHPELERARSADHLVTGTAEQLWLRLWNRGGQVTAEGEVVARLLGSRLSP